MSVARIETERGQDCEQRAQLVFGKIDELEEWAKTNNLSTGNSIINRSDSFIPQAMISTAEELEAGEDRVFLISLSTTNFHTAREYYTQILTLKKTLDGTMLDVITIANAYREHDGNFIEHTSTIRTHTDIFELIPPENQSDPVLATLEQAYKLACEELGFTPTEIPQEA